MEFDGNVYLPSPECVTHALRELNRWNEQLATAGISRVRVIVHQVEGEYRMTLHVRRTPNTATALPAHDGAAAGEHDTGIPCGHTTNTWTLTIRSLVQQALVEARRLSLDEWTKTCVELNQALHISHG